MGENGSIVDCHVNLHFKTLVLFTEEKGRGNCTNKRALRFHTTHALLESGGGGHKQSVSHLSGITIQNTSCGLFK